MGAPLNQSFAAMANGASGSLSPIQIDYRANESLFIVPGADRVVVVYSVQELFDVSNLTILPPLQSAIQILSFLSATTP